MSNLNGGLSGSGTLRGALGGGGTPTPQDVYWDDILDKPDFAEVATSGSYNDLLDKPSIPNYTAGDNVTIENGVISATDTTYTAGSGISITNGVISATGETGAQPIYFDFTKNLIDKNHFVCPSSTTKYANNGLTFNSANDYFAVNRFLLAKNMAYELDIASMNITDTTRHNTLFRYQNVGGNQNAGFIYRYQSLKWAVWDSFNGWQESEISDKDYFNNSILKVKILSDGKWEIYKDDVLVFAPSIAPVFEGTDSFGLGSPSACITNITINSFKIYPNIEEVSNE